jgi:2-phospho-L-lactate guanylyltransferase
VKTLAILPVKSFATAKQRLSGSLGTGARQALARAMFSDVLSSLRRVPGLDDVVVVTADRVAEAASTADGVRVLPDTVQAGQSEAALIGVRHALAEGYDRVLLVPGDTPLVQPGDLAGLLAVTHAVAIVPDRHGTGTNALMLTPPDVIEPSFGPDSLARHVGAAEDAGVANGVEEILALALDVDTPDDLSELMAELELRRGQAPSTRGALLQLDRAGGSPARVPQASA